MPTGVNIPQRIVQAVAVRVQALRVCPIRHNGIRADEPADGGVVVAGGH